MKGNVFFECGGYYSNVNIDEASVGMRICVFDSERSMKTLEYDKKKEHWTCLGCPCKRKAKRQERNYWTEDKEPTGIYITCLIAKIETLKSKR